MNDLDLHRHLLAICERVAKQYNLAPQRVSISFDVWSQEDGGPSFSIVLQVPKMMRNPPNKRIFGMGTTFAEAEEDLARKMERD